MKRALLPIAVVAFAFITPSAFAGNVNLVVSNRWDSIAVVEVRSGLDAPSRGSIQRFDNVAGGTRLGTYADKACYRRSSNPSDANSRLGSWRCKAQSGGGTTSYTVD